MRTPRGTARAFRRAHPELQLSGREVMVACNKCERWIGMLPLTTKEAATIPEGYIHYQTCANGGNC